MPVVPVAEARGALAPLNPGRAAPVATPAAFGAEQGRDLQQLGQAARQATGVLDQHRARFQEREDTAKVREAYLAFDARVRSYLNDPEKGVYTRRGAGARGVSEEAFKTLDELERKAAEGLTNPRQQELFRARAAGLKSGQADSIARYEFGELRQADNETTKAVLESTVQGAIGAARSPQLREEYRAQGIYELNRMAQLHGWSKEQLAVERTKYDTLFHKGVIERMLVDDPTGAKGYYEKNQGEINGATRTEIEASLKTGVTRERAKAETESIVAAGGGLTEWLSKARDIEDAALSDEVVRRVKERFSEQEALRSKAERDAKDAAWAIVANSKSLDDVPPHVMSKLDGYTIVSMQNYVEKAGNPTTDQAKYYELSTQAGRTPEEFAKVNLLDHRAQLSNSDFQYLAGLQRSINAAIRGDAAQAAEVDRIGTMQQQIGAAMDKAGLDGGEKGREARGAFQQAARAALKAETDAKGRNLTEPEVDQVLARLALKGEVRSGKWFIPNRTAYAFEVPPEEQTQFIAVPYGELTPEQRELASAALKAKGLPVTEEAVERLHTRLVTGGR